LVAALAAAQGWAQAPAGADPYQPISGQAGKDVVWVPTPPALVEKMLDMAGVTAKDYVVDLGSGDGRNVIAAAKRGARAQGVEYNQDLVALSERAAAAEGVAGKAKFVQGDMYQADLSGATVLALFLLPDNLRKLTPKFLDLRPGTRIVVNAYRIEGWQEEETGKLESDCRVWCTAYLYLVPAKVAGTWRIPQGELTLAQEITGVSGTMTVGGLATPIANGRMRGQQISFSAAGVRYTGRADGDTLRGDSEAGPWHAVRVGD
jgi:SAM-dependent methyltransferase